MRTYLLILMILSSQLSADLNQKLNYFYENFGGSVNVNNAAIYEGQKAGYMTGGGVTVRNRLHNTQLANVQLPRFDAGCGGIDIYNGGISFVSKDELVDTIKGIGSSAAGYAFMLGMETVSPTIANQLKWAFDAAQYINGLNINSCEIASAMVGSVWPKKTMASQQICRKASTGDGMFWDYVSARHECANPSNYQQVEQRMKSNPPSSNFLGDEYNLAWAALQEQNLTKDRAFAELLMSLMGTRVVRKNGDDTDISSYPSLASDQGFLSMLLHGGESEGYACHKDSDDKCLIVEMKEWRVSEEDSWVGKMKSDLSKMQECILLDKELESTQRDLLARTRLPLYKFINVMTAYRGKSSLVDLTGLSEIVAMDMLTQYLRESLEILRQGTSQLSEGQQFSDEVKEYLKRLSEVERNIGHMETRSQRLMEQEFALVQRVEFLEEKIAAELRL